MNHPDKGGKSRRRFILPIFIAMIGAFFLIGCIYLPIPEHKVGADPDFRPMLGDENSSRPIRSGAITRAQIIQRLGTPPFASADGRAIGYKVSTEAGLAIWPMCFAAAADQNGAYVVRLIFDEHDVLKKWDVAHYISPGGSFGFGNAGDTVGVYEAVKQLSANGPALFSMDRMHATTQP